MTTPAPGNLFFLPQKPYMPLGPLRSQLLFPSGAPHPPWQQENNIRMLVAKKALVACAEC